LGAARNESLGPSTPMQQAFAHCEALVRAADRDRFLATLFAPRERRGALFALYAFNVEIARVREVVRDPVAGEIRLQWWSDVLAGDGRGEIEAHPVASALRASVARYGLPPERLQTTISARRFDLYDEPMATLADLEAYADGASSSLIALAAQILNGDGASDQFGGVHFNWKVASVGKTTPSSGGSGGGSGGYYNYG